MFFADIMCLKHHYVHVIIFIFYNYTCIFLVLTDGCLVFTGFAAQPFKGFQNARDPEKKKNSSHKESDPKLQEFEGIIPKYSVLEFYRTLGPNDIQSHRN